MLNDRLANDVCRNVEHSSGTDDDRVLRALVCNEMCWLLVLLFVIFCRFEIFLSRCFCVIFFLSSMLCLCVCVDQVTPLLF